MSRVVLPDNAYTFRTYTDDDYTERVLAEADPDANFLVITGENKLTKEKTLHVYVRNGITALSLLKPDVKLGPEPLTAWFEQAFLSAFKKASENANLAGTLAKDFIGMTIEGDSEGLAKVRTEVEQDIRHINNVLQKRVVQVVVEAF